LAAQYTFAPSIATPVGSSSASAMVTVAPPLLGTLITVPPKTFVKTMVSSPSARAEGTSALVTRSTAVPTGRDARRTTPVKPSITPPLVQNTFFASTAIALGSSSPAEMTSGAPPASGARITLPVLGMPVAAGKLLSTKYAYVASTAIAYG